MLLESYGFGVFANIASYDPVFRKGALVLLGSSNGGDFRYLVLGVSRGGRFKAIYRELSKLENFRSKYIPHRFAAHPAVAGMSYDGKESSIKSLEIIQGRYNDKRA